MGAKIAALLVTMAAGLAGGVAILFFMLVAMNGYSESDATWGFGVYILLALVACLLTGFFAYFVTGQLTKREFSPVVASLIAIAIFSIVGFGLEIVSSLIGVGVAEFVRLKF